MTPTKFSDNCKFYTTTLILRVVFPSRYLCLIMTRNNSNNQSCHANIFPRNLFKILDKYGAQKIAFVEGGEIHGSEPSRHVGKAPKEKGDRGCLQGWRWRILE